MSTRHGRRMPSGPGGERQRFPATACALALGAVLVLTALSGRADLISAFSGDGSSLDRLIALTAAHHASLAAQAPATPANLQAATATPGATSLGAACEPSGDERFCLYTVQEGDSLASIASRFDLDGGSLPGWELLFASNQPDLASLDDFVQPGLVLRVPNSNGVLHLVLPGDSVSRLAEDYGVTTLAIATANGLADANNVQIGDIMFIPEPTSLPQPELPPEPEPTEEPEGDPPDAEGAPEDEGEETDQQPEGAAPGEGEASDEQTGDSDGAGDDGDSENNDASEGDEEEQGGDADGDAGGAGGQPDDTESDEEDAGSEEEDDEPTEPEEAEAPAEPTPEPPADDPQHMAWPVVAVKITNYMTARHPLGMDFGLAAHQGSPITAAAGGTVSFAGGNACCSYGLYVIVDHGDGLQTLYAHLSSITVTKGEAVARGAALGIAGATGNSRGVHLHFEVYKNGKRVDPMNYLPHD